MKIQKNVFKIAYWGTFALTKPTNKMNNWIQYPIISDRSCGVHAQNTANYRVQCVNVHVTRTMCTAEQPQKSTKRQGNPADFDQSRGFAVMKI